MFEQCRAIGLDFLGMADRAILAVHDALKHPATLGERQRADIVPVEVEQVEDVEGGFRGDPLAAAAAERLLQQGEIRAP